MYPPAGPTRASAEPPSADGRVIIHLDLDAFYAQVESRRLGIHTSTPLVVQQWRGIIAVNYAARAAGIKRHLTVDEAAKLCPGVVFVHVETIGDDEDEEDDEHVAEDHPRRDANETKKNDYTVENENENDLDDALRRATTYRPSDGGTVTRNDERSRRDFVTNEYKKKDAPDRERRKVSLARYRRASVAVMETLADAFPDGAVERASVDEAYVDVTREVDAILKNSKNSNDIAARLITAGMEASGHVRSLRPEASVSDARLALGAEACRRARAAVFAKTGYTMSGGIAHNKMLAKLASARNKPNKQTVVSRLAVSEMLENLPMRSIKGLGGKLGERVERALVERFAEKDAEGPSKSPGASRSAAQRQARSGTGRGSSYEGGFTAASLRFLFSNARNRNRMGSGLDDKTSAWLERVSRGEDSDPVVANVRDGAKSVTAFKSFKPVFEKARAHTWLKVLALELAERLAEDRRRFSRTPRTVRLEWRAEPNARALPPRESFETRSKTFAFPADATAALGSGNTPRAGEALTHAATRVFDALGPEATLPCTRVGLAASDFAPIPGARGGGIERFFVGADEKTKSFSSGFSSGPTRPVRDSRAVCDADSAIGRPVRDSDVAASPGRSLVRSPKSSRAEESETNETRSENAVKTSSASFGAVFPKARFSSERETAFFAETVSKPSEDVSADDACVTARTDALVACPRCGLRTAPGSDAQSHADEHLAFDLSKSEPQHRSAGAGAGSKRGKSHTARGGGGKKRAGERARQARDAAGTASVSAFFAKR
jgi:DNA polymerase eta